jgi:hypothetical protein
MSRSRRPRAVLIGLVAVAGSLIVAGVAYGTGKISYSGKTSQHQQISFAISASKLTNLGLRIDIRCPSHHVYRLNARGFTAITIKSNATFDQKFTSHNPKATFILKGRVGHKMVTGSVTLSEFVAKEHHFCFGKATFAARPRR